jgi:hypothetical protein
MFAFQKYYKASLQNYCENCSTENFWAIRTTSIQCRSFLFCEASVSTISAFLQMLCREPTIIYIPNFVEPNISCFCVFWHSVLLEMFPTAEFGMITAGNVCWDLSTIFGMENRRKSRAKFFTMTFTCLSPSYLFYAWD